MGLVSLLRRSIGLRRLLPLLLSVAAGIGISVASNAGNWSYGVTLGVALGALTLIAMLGLPLALLPFDWEALRRQDEAELIVEAPDRRRDRRHRAYVGSASIVIGGGVAAATVGMNEPASLGDWVETWRTYEDPAAGVNAPDLSEFFVVRSPSGSYLNPREASEEVLDAEDATWSQPSTIPERMHNLFGVDLDEENQLAASH